MTPGLASAAILAAAVAMTSLAPQQTQPRDCQATGQRQYEEAFAGAEQAAKARGHEYLARHGEAYAYETHGGMRQGYLLLRQTKDEAIFMYAVILHGEHYMAQGYYRCSLRTGYCNTFNDRTGEIPLGVPRRYHVAARVVRDIRAGKLRIFSDARSALIGTPWQGW